MYKNVTMDYFLIIYKSAVVIDIFISSFKERPTYYNSRVNPGLLFLDQENRTYIYQIYI